MVLWRKGRIRGDGNAFTVIAELTRRGKTMNKKALLVIDVQNAMFDEGIANGETLLQNLKKLISKARATNTPVFYIQHNEVTGEPLENGTKGWEIHPDITPVEGIDTVIQKTRPDSFFQTNLETELEKKGIEHLILTGLQTEMCVDTTCRRAVSMEYQVTLVSDAHGTFHSQELTAEQIINHHNNTLRWFADLVSTDQIDFK